jgi:hypothetical protein
VSQPTSLPSTLSRPPPSRHHRESSSSSNVSGGKPLPRPPMPLPKE